MKKIGLTTTVPVEVLIAAGYTPVDLNNVFVSSKEPMHYIDAAERAGFPKSLCAWIKGIYGVCLEENIGEVVGVIEGDCSNTKALLDVLRLKGVQVHPFAFPQSHTPEAVEAALRQFMADFHVTVQEAEAVRKELRPIRQLAKRIDELTYCDCKASGFENHLYQVSLSDFNGDLKAYEEELKEAVKEIEGRMPAGRKLRLGYIGVPPMTAELYSFAENFDAHFIFNEVQREFTFPREEQAESLFMQYYDYTYPYDVMFRIKELKEQIKLRKLDAVIHYTQAFCYRAVEDIVLKSHLDIPVLNIEGDKQSKLDARTKLRLEAFLDMLLDLKESRK